MSLSVAGWVGLSMALLIASAGDTIQAQAPSAPDQQPPSVQETVTVVGATPIDGIGIDRNQVPFNVQTLITGGPGQPGRTSVADEIYSRLASVHVNEAITNPLQPDIQFRGFTASPLLGLPQGLAVYQNGVRLNEPFGDTVNWDLLPAAAVASINLIPGSNPLFGLNTLGGAVSVQTKTGFSHPGHTLTASAGSFGRGLVEASTGGRTERVGYFIAGTALTEDGWRDFSLSRMRQLFGDVEYRSGATTINGTVTAAFNRLIGNGPAPVELLEVDRAAVFTHPDETKTRMALASWRVRHSRGSSALFEGTAYYRGASIRALNGDDSDYDACEDERIDGFLCTEEGEGDLVRNQFGGFVAVEGDDELNGTNNTSATRTNGWGGVFQTTLTHPIGGRGNHFVAGISVDGGGSRYEAATEIARLTDDRGTIGTGLFDAEASVDVKSAVRHTGIYAADFLTAAPRLTVMGAVRFNHSALSLRDQIGTDLNGDHRFTRINPAVGLTYATIAGPVLYGSFSMSSRAPAPSELSCADPDDPCRLPNAFLADPPLKQVVARTWEGGVRVTRGALHWNATVFRTRNSDDIMFVSSGPLTNTGHFENVGDTVRQGLELGATGQVGTLRWTMAYSFLRARFDTALTLSSPNHPAEDEGEIEVPKGSRLPGVPQHNFKATLSASLGRLGLEGTLLKTSSQYLRGDEANRLPAIDGFTLVNLTGGYAITPRLRLALRVTNLFNATYETFGLLGEADEVLGDDYEDPRFVSPGTPRAAWAGVELSFR
jgi:outer membrane receptor protein involved in Fe transport